MRRADRLFQIVQKLRGGRHTTARALAEALEVSERTIYRDIADLQASGVPVEGEAGFGYVMAEGYDLPPLMFTQEEILALVVGARLVRAWGGAAMAKGAEEALVKIEAVLSDAARAQARAVQVHAFPFAQDPQVAARLDAIEAAVEARRRLVLDYEDRAGRASQRVVRPLGQWFWGKVWTLVAWCELRQEFRVFRVDRIRGMTEGDVYKREPGKDLAAFFAEMEAGRRS